MGSESDRGSTPVSVGCLFAAIGGFSRAFEQSGAVVSWANDKDHFAARTYRLNFPDVRFIEKPIEDLTVHADHLTPVDVLTAGFPCQAFSVAGDKRGFADPRGLLFLHIIRLIREFGRDRPKVLLLENVKNLRAHDKGRTFARIQVEIQRAGYWFSEANAQVLNTAEYTGIPQNRERVFMVAVSQDHFASNAFVFPVKYPPAKRQPVRSFLDLSHKADPAFYFTPASQYYDLFREAIAEGGAQHVYQLRRNYVRQNMSGMCFTLMANMGDGGHNQPVIKDRWGIRKLTPRECARLQGYEDSWFQIPDGLSNTQLYKQVGNSVTVPLVERLAERIVGHIYSLRGKGEE